MYCVKKWIKPHSTSAVVSWIEACDEETPYLSFITIGEQEKGVAMLPLCAMRARLRIWFRSDLVERFHQRLLAIDQPVAVKIVDDRGIKSLKVIPRN